MAKITLKRGRNSVLLSVETALPRIYLPYKRCSRQTDREIYSRQRLAYNAVKGQPEQILGGTQHYVSKILLHNR